MRAARAPSEEDARIGASRPAAGASVRRSGDATRLALTVKPELRALFRAACAPHVD